MASGKDTSLNLKITDIKFYKDINEYISALGTPRMKCEEFYIVEFKPEYVTKNTAISYKHNYFEISFAIGYDATVAVGKDIINPLQLNLSFVSPGQVTTWNVQEIEKDSISFMILFQPDFLLFGENIINIYKKFPYFNHFTSPGYNLNKRQQDLFIDLFQKLNTEYQIVTKDSLEIIRSYLTIFLFSAKKELEFTKEVNFTRNRSQEIAFNFENLVINTKSKRQPIEYYAQKMNISSIYLAECVKKETRKTVKQVTNEYLIMESKSLLRQSKKSIAEIAYSLDFQDDSYFIKYFKRYTGLTPKQFRLSI